MTHKGRESLGLFLPNFGPQCWEKMPDGFSGAVFPYMSKVVCHHPAPSKSFSGRLSMILGRVLSWSLMDLEEEQDSINDLWGITGSDLRASKMAYVFILS